MEGSYYTMKEIQKLRVIRNVMEKKLSQKDAAEILGVTDRQVRRIVVKIQEKGDIGIKHQNTFNKPATFIGYETRQHIVDLKVNKYPDTNFAHFRELLEENENIKLSYSAVYNILRGHGIISKKHLKRRRKTHLSRPRRTTTGELLQLDASKHDWFSNGTYYHLHGSIDDATGIITGLYMGKEETTNSYLEIMKQTINSYGIPIALYTDGRTVFFYPKDTELTDEEILDGDEEKQTQFTKAVGDLGIEVIHAHSPQAKGRIERLWQTLQDRLVVLFSLNNITTIEQANEYLVNTFIPDFNKKFSVEAQDSSYLALKKDINLDLVLAKRYPRIISHDSSFSFSNSKYVVTTENATIVPVRPKDIINVIETTTKKYKVLVDKLYYNMIKVKDYYQLLEFKRNDKEINYDDFYTNIYHCTLPPVSELPTEKHSGKLICT